MIVLQKEGWHKANGDTCGTIFNITHNENAKNKQVCCKVLVKGCPLHCHDFQTPNDSIDDPELSHYKSRCSRCGDHQEDECPNQQGMTEHDEEDAIAYCTHCGGCKDACPSQKISPQTLPSTEVIFKALKNPRITSIMLTGGEPLTQPEFCIDTLKKAKAIGLSTIVDTTGYADWKVLEQFIPYTDQFLYEIKLVDAKSHHLYAGFSNKLVLDNLKNLRRAGCNVTIRYPIHTGFNDDADTATSIANLAEECGVKSINIMKNPRQEPLKKAQTNQLQRRNRLPEPSADRTELLQEIFSIYCIDATIEA